MPLDLNLYASPISFQERPVVMDDQPQYITPTQKPGIKPGINQKTVFLFFAFLIYINIITNGVRSRFHPRSSSYTKNPHSILVCGFFVVLQDLAKLAANSLRQKREVFCLCMPKYIIFMGLLLTQLTTVYSDCSDFFFIRTRSWRSGMCQEPE